MDEFPSWYYWINGMNFPSWYTPIGHPTEIELELWIPQRFPQAPPAVRLMRPCFVPGRDRVKIWRAIPPKMHEFQGNSQENSDDSDEFLFLSSFFRWGTIKFKPESVGSPWISSPPKIHQILRWLTRVDFPLNSWRNERLHQIMILLQSPTSSNFAPITGELWLNSYGAPWTLLWWRCTMSYVHVRAMDNVKIF